MSAGRIAITAVAVLLLLLGGPSERSAARPTAEPIDCDSLWPGFAFPASQEIDEQGSVVQPAHDDNPEVCIEVDRIGAVRVFYPANVYFDHVRKNFYDSLVLGPVSDAVNRSLGIFDALNPAQRLGPVNVFLVDTPDYSSKPSERDTIYAETRARRTHMSTACPVLVFTKAVERNSTGRLTSQVLGQTLAHELFHCFQARNYAPQFDASGSPNRTGWWVEGTAEYFANLVYPAANAEYEFIDSLRSREPGHTPIDLEYENFLFFQFLGNRITNPGVVRLIGSMPTLAVRERQLDRLAAFPGMQEHFHLFARAYLDDAVHDTSGPRIIVRPLIDDELRLSTNRPIVISAKRFVISRSLLTLKKGNRYTLAVRTEGMGRSAVRLAGKKGNWHALPGIVTTPCAQNSRFVLLLTAISPGYKLILDVQKVEKNESCKFAITNVELPAAVVANGPRGDLKVFWTGTPRFPVKMVYEPDSCPPDVECLTVSATFSASTNPLVFAKAVSCFGSFRSPTFFDYSVYLRDAKGARTKNANADFSCRPG
jgi:Family of unknown function (DUF6055)